MLDLLSQPWPWYIAGPLIGLLVPLLLLIGGRSFGVSANLRHACAAALPTRAEFFRYDWRSSGGWNAVFVLGVVGGGLLSTTVLAGDGLVAISEATRADLAALGVTDFSGLVPNDLFSWASLGTGPGLIAVVLGGFLVGFGARWAGGCTSGHAITGLANLQLPSLLAVIGFFAGGLLVTHFVLPYLL